MVAGPAVLVVGGGLTAASAVRSLRRVLPAERILVWEASASLGGRFCTDDLALPSGTSAVADTGAQYVTSTDAADGPLYAELRDAGVLMPLAGRIRGSRAADGGGENFVAPRGLSSIVSHMFGACGVAPTCSRRAVGLRRGARGGWDVHAETGEATRADGVILTPPVPHTLALIDSGEARKWLDATPARAALDSIEYSKRYALALAWPADTRPLFSASADYVSRYVDPDEDDAIVYVAIDSARRADHVGPVSLTVHSSVPYGLRMMGSGADDAAVQADLLGRLNKLLPWLPPPAASTLRRWPISQVRFPLPDSLLPGGPCLPLVPPNEPAEGGAGAAPAGLVLAGDAFTPLGSRFDGCVRSGAAAADALLGQLSSASGREALRGEG